MRAVFLKATPLSCSDTQGSHCVLVSTFKCLYISFANIKLHVCIIEHTINYELCIVYPSFSVWCASFNFLIRILVSLVCHCLYRHFHFVWWFYWWWWWRRWFETWWRFISSYIQQNIDALLSVSFFFFASFSFILFGYGNDQICHMRELKCELIFVMPENDNNNTNNGVDQIDICHTHI